MSRNIANHDPRDGTTVVYLEDYRRPLDGPEAQRIRRNRRRLIAAVSGVLIVAGGVTVAAVAGNAQPESYYCGYAVTEETQGGQAIADSAARSQHLPRPGNDLQAGEVINKLHPNAGSRYVMWIASDGAHDSTVQTGTIQPWHHLDNPCDTISGPQPHMFPITADLLPRSATPQS